MSLPDNTDPVPLTVHGSRANLSRREAMQWVLTAVAASALPGADRTFGQVPPPPVAPPATPMKQEDAARIPDPVYPGGYGTDPKLVPPHKPGEYWPLTLDEAQKKAATLLADTIVPADDLGPAASTVGVVAMIDEWISAPYPQQRDDRPVILEGLAWLDAEAKKRYGDTFANLAPERVEAICDDICFTREAKAEFKEPAKFFSRFRSLVAGAYYATPAGWKAIGYVGNIALPGFEGPPAEVLEKLGVTQTVA